MSDRSKTKRVARKRRHARVRKTVRGTAARPAFGVFRSNKHITAQVIDDRAGTTIAAASSTEARMRATAPRQRLRAKQVGSLLAERAKAKGVSTVVFDRGGYLYHGRIAALADCRARSRPRVLNPEGINMTNTAAGEARRSHRDGEQAGDAPSARFPRDQHQPCREGGQRRSAVLVHRARGRR
jgi:large subunit ribosomal protein L18